MIPGIKIQMGGQDWQIPPLTLGQLRRLAPALKDLRGADEDMALDALCEIVAAALSRNYPMIEVGETSSYEPKFTGADGITRTPMSAIYVADLLDLGNKDAVVAAVMGKSGMQPGEATAVAGSNGALSMGFSPPPAVTVTQ